MGKTFIYRVKPLLVASHVVLQPLSRNQTSSAFALFLCTYAINTSSSSSSNFV
ncbi:hypothetical protein Fmac_025404 [Flemingia macrophylla]|uniref:Uncharacterized protein n=1 Tax=Flemingia macrophylla TaxID=520843 RepID=A0ABD1LSA1_9FABA